MNIIKIFAILGLLFVSQGFSEEKEMTWEEYTAELAKHVQREKDAQAKITALEADVTALQSDVDAAKQKLVDIWNEMLQFAGITQEEYDAFVQGISDFISNVRGFESQFGDAFKEWKAALSQADTDFQGIKANKIAAFPRLDNQIASAESALSESYEAYKLASANSQPTEYEVRLIPERRDCLWRIAEYEEIYGDPFKWPTIYSANKQLIKDPDLIYPGQVFSIPR